MKTSDMLKEEFEKLEITDDDCMDLMYTIAQSIPAQIPFRMKMAMAVSEIITWASMFRIHIRHWNRSIIPVNAISFIIAKSGYSKDSSLRAVRTCFEGGYDVIRRKQKEEAKDKAIRAAAAKGDDDNWLKYYLKPNPLFVAISTPEGMIQHLADMQELELGAGYIADSEFAQSLQSTANMAEILKNVSICYDMGNIDQKMLKDRSLQTKEIRSMPMSMMMLSSQDLLIWDDAIKKKFKLEFTSKLARRSFFTFANEKVFEPNFTNLDEMLAYERKLEDIAIQSSDKAYEYITGATEKIANSLIKTLSVSDGVRDMFIFYKKYNEYKAEEINLKYPISRLTRAHMQWKALKLSGGLAILDKQSMIMPQHYRAAMWFTEMISDDVYKFEIETQKEGYELFVDYMHSNLVRGRSEATVHTMRKMGFINNNSRSLSVQINEMAIFCNSYDNTGLYEAVSDKIVFVENDTSEKCLISYVDVKGTKEQRGKMSASGYQTEDVTFAELAGALREDIAYSNFRFKDGKHNKESIDSGCKWIVLDVDDTMVTDIECDLILEGINHHIARTSDPSNATKYRVLLELDRVVNVSSDNWIQFIANIAEDFGINHDRRGKSQIWFAYANRQVLSCTDGIKLNAKAYMNFAEKQPKKQLTAKAKSQLLKTPMDTFHKTFEAVQGNRATSLFWAVRYAKELGADLEYCKKLVDDVQAYWTNPLPSKQIHGLNRQMERWEW